MTQLQDARLPLPARAGRASHDASISLISFNGLGTASSACGNEPQELLGLSAGPPPMSISSTTLPRTSSRSPGSRQQLYASDFASDYNCPQDLDLTDQQGSRQNWGSYQVTESNNEQVADPLQRLASAEPEQLPWSGIHLNGVPASQLQREQMERSSSASRIAKIGQQRSIVGSHANQTDEGYYTHSQVDARSVYSGDSNQMHQVRAGQSLVPRTIPATQGQSAFASYNDTSVYRATNYQVREPMEPPTSSPNQQEPLRCPEIGCSFSCKTRSDLKKHTARHKREHVCKEPRCLRDGKGFATINDLERHQKTVHKIEPTHRQSRTYKCYGANCKQYQKEWPRFDNFKQHLVRMHKTESTDELIQQSNEWYHTEKKPLQAEPIPPPDIQSSDSHLRVSKSNPWFEIASHPQQSQSHLSTSWKPTTHPARLQHVSPPNRPRHASFSSQPDPSTRTFPFAVPSSGHSQSGTTTSGGGHQRGQTPNNSIPKHLSSDSVFGYAHQMPHGRLTSAFTVPNPDTPALSDLSEISLPSYPANFPTAQNDLAQIATNFPSEQQSSLSASDQDMTSPSTSVNPAQRSPGSSRFSIEAIRAFIEGNASRHQTDSDAFIEQVMQAALEKVRESQYRPATATTTSPAPSSVRSTNLTSNPDVTETHLLHRCTELPCKKAYPRACDLKKHLKRHFRPYGCTFSKCAEKFGSKYDWKRHENSQHFQQECWKCVLCAHAKLFYTRRLYEAHLKSMHTASQTMIDEHLLKQRIGRDYKNRFWCGFCKGIVALHKKGLEGVDERFNHIDKHYDGGMKIEAWVDMDRSVARGRLEDEADEAGLNVQDVLGSDGISGTDTRTGEDQDDDMDEGGSYNVRAAQPTTGQKRTAPSDFNVPSSSSSDTRPPKRPQIDSNPARGTQRARFVVCHNCTNGPWLLQTTSRCVDCAHDVCKSCTYITDRVRN